MGSKADDWISGIDVVSQQNIKNLLTLIIQHRPHYENSKDPAVSQLWFVAIELFSRIEILEKRIESLENLKSRPYDLSLLDTLDNY
ncbi:MAG: hypothetical protein K0B02_01090 [DPANN group archaeon]|nr:hypothetical protein [DPANN group archaeon]